MKYNANSVEVGYIHVGNLEVKVYRDSDGSLSAEVCYCGVVQNRLSAEVVKLLVSGLEMVDC
jgi:hypothetical protein